MSFCLLCIKNADNQAAAECRQKKERWRRWDGMTGSVARTIKKACNSSSTCRCHYNRRQNLRKIQTHLLLLLSSPLTNADTVVDAKMMMMTSGDDDAEACWQELLSLAC